MTTEKITCQMALKQLFSDPSILLSTEDVYGKLDSLYPDKPWKRNTIYLHLHSFSINHPGRKHHPHTEGKCFLFWTDDRKYRKWNPQQDGLWVLREGRVVPDLAEAEIEGELANLGPNVVVEGPSSLSIEQDLEVCLSQNLQMLEPGLIFYNENHVLGRQLDTNTVGIMDLLAIDRSGDLVVIELKAGEAGDKVCGQILRYIGWVQKNLAKGRRVRGIIVANAFTEGIRYAAQATGIIELKKYEIQFKFDSVSWPSAA